MPVVATTMLTHMAWRPAMASLAIVISVVILPLAFVIVRTREKVTSHSDSKPAITTREILRNKDVYLLGVAYFVPASLFVAVLQNMGLYALVMAVGKFAAGSLADRISHHTIYYTLLGLATVGMIAVATSKSFVPLASGVLLLAATAGGVLPLVSTAAAQRFGIANFGRAMGVIMGFGSLSGVAPLTAGWIRDYSGSYEVSFLVLAPLMLPALICFSRLKKHQAEPALA